VTEDRPDKILIVDDGKMNRTILSKVFAADYTVMMAENGTEALELVDKSPPDVILLDVVMPGMDGYVVLKTLKSKAQTQEIPILFVTSLDSPEEEEKGLVLGAADYVTKPIHPAIVRARVRNQLEVVRKRKLLEDLALLDGLTEINNRRKFEVEFEREWLRAMRNGAPLSVAMLDVDCFKLYNDTAGHQAGDEALKIIAKTLRSQLKRAGDLVARYGGEEFVMLLPDAESDKGQKLAQNVGQAVEALNIPHESNVAASCVTVSIGGATTIPQKNADRADFLKMADDALYRAKEKGRNRVIWS